MFHSHSMLHNGNGATNGQPQHYPRRSSRGPVVAPQITVERDEPKRAHHHHVHRHSQDRQHHGRIPRRNSPPPSTYVNYPYDTGSSGYVQRGGNGYHDSSSSDRSGGSDSSGNNTVRRFSQEDKSESPVGREDSNSPILSGGDASPLSPPPNCVGLVVNVGADEEPRIGDSVFTQLPSPASLIRPLTPVEPLTPRRSPLKSGRILFLDVDGVLLSTKCQQQMKEGQLIKFNPKMKECMTRIAHETNCDIVVSSSWQFYEDHLQQLNAFLMECGWARDSIHTLVDTLGSDITRDKYEQAPYCQSRSRGIMKMIEKHSMSIQNWVAIDDLPLSSTQHVCVPLKDDCNELSGRITNAYMHHIFSYFRDKENIRQWRPHVVERTFHALTVPAHALFSWKSLLFGFEFTEDTVQVQARTVCDWIAITDRIVDPAVKANIVQSVEQVINEYCLAHCGVQGYPEMQDHFVRTDMNTGLTEADTEKVISVLNEGVGSHLDGGVGWFAQVFSPRQGAPDPSMASVAEDERETTPEVFPIKKNIFGVPGNGNDHLNEE